VVLVSAEGRGEASKFAIRPPSNGRPASLFGWKRSSPTFCSLEQPTEGRIGRANASARTMFAARELVEGSLEGSIIR
jgi:hypothetical protein